jgi:hypothetical protein
MREMGTAHKMLVGRLKTAGFVVRLGVDGRIIVHRILKFGWEAVDYIHKA